MADSLLTPAAKGEWAVLLDRIEASINLALDETAAQEKALASALPADGQPPDAGLATDRAAGSRVRLDAAGRIADAVTALLAADEEEARAWTGLASRAGARLASLPAARV
jgi:hypothetical protein